MVKYENGALHYFDKNGVEILENSKIRFSNGRVETVYRTENDELGTDATNKKWIEWGRAVPCEFGVYPLTFEETDEVEVVE